MKKIAIVAALLATTLTTHAEEAAACDGKAEMKQSAEAYRNCANENKSAALDACDESSPQPVKLAASKIIASRHKIGDIEERLAAAYEAGDRRLIPKLHGEKLVAEWECEVFEKEKKAASIIHQIDELARELPQSPEVDELKARTEADLKAYLGNAAEMMKLQQEQLGIENRLRILDAKVELVRKRGELKRLEEELTSH